MVPVEFMALEVCFLSLVTIDNIGVESILCEREKLDFVKIVIFSSCLSFKNGKRKPKRWFEGHNKKTLFYVWFCSYFEANFISIMNYWQYLAFGLAYFLHLGIYSCCLKGANDYLKKTKL